MAKKQEEAIKKVEVKELTIKYDENGIPAFSFIGEWSGKDVSTIHRLLVREYRRSQRNVRRSTVVNQEEK